MKITFSLICIIFLLSTFNKIKCSIHEFIVSLPTAVGETVSNAWSDVVKALKTPIRLKKRHRKIKKETTPATTESTEYSLETFTENNAYTEISNVRPTIPIFYQPQWTHRFDWRFFERPSLVQIIKDMREIKTSTTERQKVESYNAATFRKTMVSDENDDNQFGVLFFI